LPPVVVRISDFFAISGSSFLIIQSSFELSLKYLLPLATIGIASGNATASLRGRGGAKGNFSRTAEQGHVARPPLSQQIQKQEDVSGKRSFDRMKREAKLTPHGEAFLRRAVRIGVMQPPAARCKCRARTARLSRPGRKQRPPGRVASEFLEIVSKRFGYTVCQK
jgi:hypothetical protein